MLFTYAVVAWQRLLLVTLDSTTRARGAGVVVSGGGVVTLVTKIMWSPDLRSPSFGRVCHCAVDCGHRPHAAAAVRYPLLVGWVHSNKHQQSQHGWSISVNIPCTHPRFACCPYIHHQVWSWAHTSPAVLCSSDLLAQHTSRTNSSM